MKKFLIIAPLITPYLFSGTPSEGDTKPVPPISSITEEAVEMDTITFVESSPEFWQCTVVFYDDGSAVYSEFLDQDEPYAFRAVLSASRNNRIDQFSWYGSRCNCWVNVFYRSDFNGPNLGYWISDLDLGAENANSLELSRFQSYDFADEIWRTWNYVVSSYSIYCY